MRVVGLDLSLAATGVAAFDGFSLSSETIKGNIAKQGGNIGRMEFLVDSVSTYVYDHNPDLVLIESPSFGSAGVQGFHERGGQWWATALRLHQESRRIATVSPDSLKLFATGSGRADKSVMKEAARLLVPEFSGDDNQADALWLVAMGLDYLNYPVVNRSLKERSAMNKVVWSWTGSFSVTPKVRKKRK